MKISKNKKTAGLQPTVHPKTNQNLTGNSASTQRQRLLAALRKGQVNTRDARSYLDIYHPSARISELKRIGHHIVTYREDVVSDCGQTHRIASYVLLQEARI